VSSERVSVDVVDGVAEVVLARPDKHNALDLEMFQAIRAAQREVAATPGVRAVVLRGAGPSFCSGLDLGAAAAGELDFAVLTGSREGPANLAQSTSYGWREMPVPVIAAIHGACFGGGLQIALGADVRIATRDARLSVMEVKLGLVPDMALTAALPRLVREDVARELTYTARVVDGEEAAALGLVSRVADDSAGAARELATAIAARSPDAVRAAKRLLNEAWGAPDPEGLRLETELMSELMGSPNQIEAIRAALSGDAPSFTDPLA
jgi:enoyl-CoA hydratase/carnithine racemase